MCPLYYIFWICSSLVFRLDYFHVLNIHGCSPGFEYALYWYFTVCLSLKNENWPSIKKLFGFFQKKKIRPTQWMHGLGPNHIDLRWVQIIQMYSYSNQTTSKPGLMDFCAENQKVCHSSCKIGTKRSPI